MNLTRVVTAGLAVFWAIAQTATAEVFVLANGGRVTGELVNRDESPRQRYVVLVADGGKVTFEPSQVQQVLRQKPDEAEYERIAPSYADTVEAQWELAEWCRQRKLTAQRDVHLRRVIELDSNHAKARAALGYSQVDGQWATREESMTKRGYHLYKGQWKLQQEIDIIEGKRKQEVAQQEWFQKIKRWRSWLGTGREQEGCQNIGSIANPAATKALVAGLDKDQLPQMRLLYIESLAKIDSPDTARALAAAAMFDPVEEVRLTCLDRLQGKKRLDVVSYFIGKLRDKKSTNEDINRAGVCLGRMKDPSAIPALIDALVTVHKFKIVTGGGEGSTSATFGSGGTGLSAGNKPTIIRKSFQNQSVLDALVELTGQNFNFDQQAWRYWLAAQKKPAEVLDGRRN
jgi:hypothetical protein